MVSHRGYVITPCRKLQTKKNSLHGNEEITFSMLQDPKGINFFFKQYFTDSVIDQIWRETERYTQQCIQANVPSLRSHSRVHEWKATNDN